MLALVDQELIRSGMKNQIGAGVVLTGGTALIEGFRNLANRFSTCPRASAIPTRSGAQDVVNSPMYATAVGLLMYGAEKEGVEQRFRISG